MGAIIPDFDQPKAILTRIDPHAAALLRGWFYEDEAERTGLTHRKISHRVSILLKVIIFLSLFTIFALVGTSILYPIVLFVLPFFRPYEDQFDLVFVFILFIVGITLGLFSHLWLDSTTREGIRGGKWAGDIFTGSIAEEYTRVIMSVPGIILIIIAAICLVFEMWFLVYFLAVISAILFVLLGILFRSKRFHKLVLPTKTCKYCESTWFIMKQKDSKVHFWGHPDYDTGSCKKTETIYFHPIEDFPPVSRFLLRMYLQIKSYVKKDALFQL